jgi:hypothetical protein
MCPPFSSTLGIQSASSRAQSTCDVSYADNSLITWGDNPDCRPCRVGTSCPEQGTTLTQLTLRRGYWRASNLSLDVRRCPDAGENCASAMCDNSTSGCRGGVDSTSYCAPTLEGPLCRLCKNATDRVYYMPADGSRAAACEPCGFPVEKKIVLALGVIAGVLVARLLLRILARKCPSYVEFTLKRYQKAAKLETKLKILVGFCMCTAPPIAA